MLLPSFDRRSFLRSLVIPFLGRRRLLEQGSATSVTRSPAERGALSYLASAMDRFHTTFDVYSDAYAAGNHFNARARMSSLGDEDAVSPMNELSEDNPHSGRTCIE